MSANIPLSLYIHIPWCEKKCPYCDFNSHALKAPIDEAAYVAALVADFRQDKAKFAQSLKDRELQTIFIGGGTPSLFSGESFATLFEQLKQEIDFADDIEITLEANPGSSEADKFKAFRQAGINRLSIGVQSFNPAHLKSLGRVHSSNEALQAAGYAKQAGFERINLDLMFGLPEQTFEQSIQDIEQAIALQPDHLSCYQLTIEPNTLFHAHPPVTPDDESVWQMQAQLQQCLSDANFTQYEVSAYAKPDQQCRHNLNYWRFGDYLGIGAGAHGKLTDSDYKVQRYWKFKQPSQYARSSDYIGGLNAVLAAELPFEFMLNALRLKQGFTLELFEQTTGLNSRVIESLIDKHNQLGLLNTSGEQIMPTSRGWSVLNDMLQDYLP